MGIPTGGTGSQVGPEAIGFAPDRFVSMANSWVTGTPTGLVGLGRQAWPVRPAGIRGRMHVSGVGSE